MSGPARAALLAPLLAAALLVGCAPSPPSSSSGSGDPATGTAAQYDAGLWPQRPRMSLDYDVAPDLRTVTGRETVVLIPDRPTCEAVFRAWPNNPTISATGGSLTVTGAALDGRPTSPRVLAGGAPVGVPGTLVELPLPQCLPAGGSVRVDLTFTLVLGARADERVGYDPATRTAWFGSGLLLPAWERGRGWAREDAVAMNGETATAEDAVLDLTVTAPADLVVTGTGTAAGTTPATDPGRAVHRFTAPAVRDVAVGVGAYDVLERDVDGVRLHLATPRAGTRATPRQWSDALARAVTALRPTFGPFPYPDLWVTVTPGQSDGTEFPTALQFGDVEPDELPGLAAHEVAHQWFYALVGNDQARDPWLDESFATFGETVAGTGSYELGDIDGDAGGRMGAPMASWPGAGGFEEYGSATYDQGAAVLAEARRRVGPDRFDPLLRAYVRANAHRIATPADVARAFAGEPVVVELLVRTGALQRP